MRTIGERLRRSENVGQIASSDHGRILHTFPGTKFPSISAPSGPVIRGSVAGIDG